MILPHGLPGRQIRRFLTPNGASDTSARSTAEAFSVFGAMRCAGKCVNWAQKIFDVGSPRAFDAAASNIPAGADGLVFLPYLEGERSPIYDEQAQGVFFGMTQQHRREHFLRAVLEGVGCGLSQILDVLRERDEISDLRIIGGGANPESGSKSFPTFAASVCTMLQPSPTAPQRSVRQLPQASASDCLRAFLRRFPALRRQAFSRPTSGTTTPTGRCVRAMTGSTPLCPLSSICKKRVRLRDSFHLAGGHFRSSVFLPIEASADCLVPAAQELFFFSASICGSNVTSQCQRL